MTEEQHFNASVQNVAGHDINNKGQANSNFNKLSKIHPKKFT